MEALYLSRFKVPRAEFGADPMRLHGHPTTKDELLELKVDQTLPCMHLQA